MESKTKRQKLERRVTFDEAAKTWDGIAIHKSVYDALLVQYFSGLIKWQTPADVAVFAETRMPPTATSSAIFDVLVQLESLLEELQRRLEAAADEKANEIKMVPALPQGGGTCLRVAVSHREYIQSLHKFVKDTVVLARNVLYPTPTPTPTPDPSLDPSLDPSPDLGPDPSSLDPNPASHSLVAISASGPT